MRRFVALLLVVSAVSAFQCAPGWLKHEERCYRIGNNRVNFEAARKVCSELDAQLVEINDEEEGRFIAERFSDADMWIGVTGMDGLWTLLSGRPLRYTNWTPSRSRAMSRSRMCATSQHNDLGRWVETPCESEEQFVCEKPVPIAEQLTERVISRRNADPYGYSDYPGYSNYKGYNGYQDYKGYNNYQGYNGYQDYKGYNNYNNYNGYNNYPSYPVYSKPVYKRDVAPLDNAAIDEILDEVEADSSSDHVVSRRNADPYGYSDYPGYNNYKGYNGYQDYKGYNNYQGYNGYQDYKGYNGYNNYNNYNNYPSYPVYSKPVYKRDAAPMSNAAIDDMLHKADADPFADLTPLVDMQSRLLTEARRELTMAKMLKEKKAAEKKAAEKVERYLAYLV